MSYESVSRLVVSDSFFKIIIIIIFIVVDFVIHCNETAMG